MNGNGKLPLSIGRGNGVHQDAVTKKVVAIIVILAWNRILIEFSRKWYFRMQQAKGENVCPVIEWMLKTFFPYKFYMQIPCQLICTLVFNRRNF